MPRAHEFIPDLSLRVLDNRIQLLEKLGSGSYGVVYRALELDSADAFATRRTFAVKCMLRNEAHDCKKTFNIREIDVQRRVHSHPNILTIHEVLEDEDLVYIVCDFWEGGDLYNHIFMGSESVFFGNDALLKSAFLQILEAVEFCHNNSVFHRDIKADNILCSSDLSHIVVADFGLATRRPISRQFGCGTSYYQSPECLHHDVVDIRAYSTKHSDIWSLGIVLINIISGRAPWARASMSDGCFEAFVQNPKWLRMHLPISEEAEKIICRMLDPTPHRRITLEELKEEIKRVHTFFDTDAPVATNSEQEHQEAKLSSSPIVDGFRNSVVRRVLATRSNPPCDSDSSNFAPPCSAEARLWKIIDERLHAACWQSSSSSDECAGQPDAVKQVMRRKTPSTNVLCSSTDCSVAACRQAARRRKLSYSSGASSSWVVAGGSSDRGYHEGFLRAGEDHSHDLQARSVDIHGDVADSSVTTDESEVLATPETLPIKPIVEVPVFVIGDAADEEDLKVRGSFSPFRLVLEPQTTDFILLRDVIYLLSLHAA